MGAADVERAVELLGWALIHFCWQAVLIMAAYAAVRRGLAGHRPQARLAAGHAALGALALSPLLTITALWSEIAGRGPHAAPAPHMAGVAGTFDPTAPWLAWLVAAWAAGVLVLATRAVGQWCTLRQLCRCARPVGADWQARLARLADRFGARCPRLLETTAIAAPIVVGCLKPVILLPAGLCLRLPADQVELLLAHELAHVRRWDFVANALQVALETVLFYHPAVHWISRRVRDDRELCCDDLVTEMSNAPVAYARALLAVAEQRGRLPRVALAAGGGQLLDRVRRLVAETPTRPRARLPQLLLLGLPLLALVAGLPVLNATIDAPVAALAVPELRRSVELPVAAIEPGWERPWRAETVRPAPPLRPLVPPALAVAGPDRSEPTRLRVSPELPASTLQWSSVDRLHIPMPLAADDHSDTALAASSEMSTVVCRRESVTGSRLVQRRCQPAEHTRVEREYAQAMLAREATRRSNLRL